jgi:hypothetical protein
MTKEYDSFPVTHEPEFSATHRIAFVLLLMCLFIDWDSTLWSNSHHLVGQHKDHLVYQSITINQQTATSEM